MVSCSGQEAMQKLDEQPFLPDIVLLETLLPDVDGFSVSLQLLLHRRPCYERRWKGLNLRASTPAGTDTRVLGSSALCSCNKARNDTFLSVASMVQPLPG